MTILIGGTPVDNKAVFTTKEAARFLGVSQTTIYRMEKQGLRSSMRTPDGQRRFSRDGIEQYLEESKEFQAPQNPSLCRRATMWVRELEAPYASGDLEKGKPCVGSMSSQADEPFFHRDSVWIYNANILTTSYIEDGSIDLIVTSPPYNVDIRYSSHNDTMSYKDYLAFTTEWLTRCCRFLKDDGRFCLNIPLDKNKGGQQSVCADVTTLAQRVGFQYRSTIIWN